MRLWRAPGIDEAAASGLAQSARLRPLTARILVGRGVSDAAIAARFLQPRLANLRAPEGIADLPRALDRLQRALGADERIGVFGDYDVDGVTTAAVLTLSLRALGCNVVARVASRASGYGLSPAEAKRFADDGCTVVVTGDCGTSDHEALALARSLGIDVIVIDHHQVPEGETAAFALINPHRPDDSFAFKGLASCGVAFYLAAALRSRLREGGLALAEAFDPRSLLDLVALGTIADMVPLVDENRMLVSAGLRELALGKRPGLRQLGELAGLEAGAPIGSIDVSFKLAPRLNAAGRLGLAQRALDLILATDEVEATRRAQELDDVNAERQRIQEGVWTQAQQAAMVQLDLGCPAIVVSGAGWHHGVVGIIAAKLVDKFRRPALVVGFDGDDGRGSARTIGGFNLYTALHACRDHLGAHGGHAAAAGFSVRPEAFDAFREAFVAEASRFFAAGAVSSTVEVDAQADLGELDVSQALELERIAPFGMANAQPLLVIPGVVAKSTRVVGKGHLQLTLSQHGAQGDAIAFGMADQDPGPGASLDVVATAEVDSFRGTRRTRLRVKHLLRAAP